MIDYSIAVRSAQPGLTADKVTVTKAYGQAQHGETINIPEFARHIASHGSTYSRADIAAILTLSVDCLREMLLEGKRVELGDLGHFKVGLRTEGAAQASEFTAQNIKKVVVIWTPGKLFNDLRSDARFNLVPLTKDQQEAVKKLKGQSTQGNDNTSAGGGMESE